jgi:transposase
MQSAECLAEENTALKAQLALLETKLATHQETISSQTQTIESQKESLSHLHHQLNVLRQMKFGRKSEKLKDDVQGELFDEAGMVLELESENDNTESVETITYTRKKQAAKKRNALPDNLPSVTEVHDLDDTDKQCECGCQLTHIKDEVTETLDMLPQVMFKRIHIKKKYACRNCEQTIKTAPAPNSILPRTIATPGLLAEIIHAKFNQHLPLYRQEAQFEASKTPISRGVMSEWLMKISAKLEPIAHELEKTILNYDVAYSDETTLQVLKSEHKKPTQKSYMWLFSGGPPDKRCYLYQYHPTRKHSVVSDFFDENKFKGYLHADCYEAYVKLDKYTAAVHHVACNAHARRAFADILKLNKTTKPMLAKKAIGYYKKLYAMKEPVFSSNDKRFDSTLRAVVIDFKSAILNIA